MYHLFFILCCLLVISLSRNHCLLRLIHCWVQNIQNFFTLKSFLRKCYKLKKKYEYQSKNNDTQCFLKMLLGKCVWFSTHFCEIAQIPLIKLCTIFWLFKHRISVFKLYLLSWKVTSGYIRLSINKIVCNNLYLCMGISF